MRLFSCFQDFISTLYSIISINDELHPHRARGRERFLLA